MLKHFFFDYFYYRLYKLNSNRDFRGLPPVMVISLVQTLIASEVFALLVKLFYERADTAPYAKSIAYLFCIFMFGLVFLNYKRYVPRTETFEHRWDGESKNHRIVKTVLMFVFIVLALGVMVAIGVYD